MKKWKIIVPVALVGAIAIASPFVYKEVSRYLAEKAITEEYNAYIASNKSFYDNSYFNGVDISGLTPEDALVKIEDAFEAKSLTIKSEDGTEKDTFEYSRLSVDYKNLMASVLDAYDAQTLTKAEYLNGAEKKEYTYNIPLDVDFKKTDISGLKCTDEDTRIKSSDAYISVDKVTGTLSIVEEVFGNELNESSLESKIESAVFAGEEEIVLLASDYVLPNVVCTDEALVSTQKYYETLLNKSLSFTVCGMLMELTPDDTLAFFDFEPGDEADDEAIAAYVLALKNKYDTYQSNRLFTTTTGELVTVVAGDYGWLIDKDETITAIKTAALSEKESEAVNAVYKVAGQRPADNEIGNTYVEIDLRDQKIWMYVNGQKIVDDDITTGMVGDPASITITGTFSLAYKQANVTLKGPTWNDFVYYWMPYDLTNAVGMHDATWRTDEEFGGTNRFGNGSHGCVNMRLDSAGIVYNNIQMDTPIIVWE